MSHLAGAAGLTGAAGVGGNALFSYNRENFMWDAGQKWVRYTAGYSFAQQQVGMYRADIDMLTALSVGKMDNLHAVSGLMMVIVIQLIMAGRLGVHGPAPPGWIMGQYWCNCGLMAMWLVMACWFAMHAGARAQAAAAVMKTQSVRLPIPTPKQLDKARVFGNHWERQRVLDVFRVPFVAPAPVDDPANIKDDYVEEKGKAKGIGGVKRRKTAGPSTDFRTPAWANEEIQELHGGQGGQPVTNSTIPEHFEIYRGAQHEWWSHEAYARISIFYAFTHWMAAAPLYIQCHCFIELRAMWPAWSCTFFFVTCQYNLNMIDIMRIPRPNSIFNVPMELIVPFTPLLTLLCMQLDYSVLEENRAGISIFVWVCSFFNYFTHLLYAIRMYDLTAPNAAKEEDDNVPGRPWWPGYWNVPLAFAHCLYLVAPPTHLEPGETCLWQDMKAGRGKSANGTTAPLKSRATDGKLVPSNVSAWGIMQGGLLATIFIWCFIIVGRIYAMALVRGDFGDMRYQLKQEGRTMRWPSHMQPWMTPWTRLGTRGEWCHTGGCDRRLGEFQWKSRRDMADVAERLVPQLQTISDVLQQDSKPQPLGAHFQVLTPVHRAPIAWPAGFRPELLACSHGGPVAALSRVEHGGAFMPSFPVPGAQVATSPEIRRFAFEGTKHLGEVLGSHWGKEGLMLTMKNGNLAECHGIPADGIWPCRQINTQLPTGGSSLHKAVVARIPDQKQMLRAAVEYKGDHSVVLFETDIDSGVWLPTGEVQLPSVNDQAPAFSMSSRAEELIFLTEAGGVLKWAVTEPAPSVMAHPPADDIAPGMAWQTSCQFGDKQLARLGLRHNEEAAWTPEVFISAHP
jgi:hypothetical protein